MTIVKDLLQTSGTTPQWPQCHHIIPMGPFPWRWGSCCVLCFSAGDPPPYPSHTTPASCHSCCYLWGAWRRDKTINRREVLSCCFKHRGKESSFRQLKQQLQKQRRLTWKGGGLKVRPFLQLFTIWSVTSVDPLVHWGVSTRTV